MHINNTGNGTIHNDTSCEMDCAMKNSFLEFKVPL